MESNPRERPKAGIAGRTRFGRATREALWATPFALMLAWLGPAIYGEPVTMVRAACALVAIAGAEALVDERYPPLERELLTIAIGLCIAFGLAGLIQLVWPDSV